MDGATLTEGSAAFDDEKCIGNVEDNLRAGGNDFSESTLMIWGPALMLGPTLPAMLSMVTVFIGYIILHSNPIDESGLEKCGYPINTFLSVAIANAHLLLLVFAWSFMGVKARSDVSCVVINRYLLSFTTFLVVVYWIGVAYGVVCVLQLISRGNGGHSMIARARETLHQAKAILGQDGPSNDTTTFFDDNEEITEEMIRDKFLNVATSGENGTASVASCKNFIRQCGIILTRKEFKLALEELDPNSRGEVHVDDFVDWWKGFINDFEDEADADR